MTIDWTKAHPNDRWCFTRDNGAQVFSDRLYKEWQHGTWTERPESIEMGDEGTVKDSLPVAGRAVVKDSFTTADRPEPSPDMVFAPPHYRQGEIECIDAIKSALTPEEFRGYCKGNSLKYVWRELHKGGDESLEKAMWYLETAMGGLTGGR